MSYMMRIFDKEKNSPNRIISFSILLKEMQEFMPDILDGSWKIFEGADGYGLNVCSISDSLENKKSLIISDAADLFEIILSEKEYFDHVRLKKVYSSLEIGVFDSTFLFV